MLLVIILAVIILAYVDTVSPKAEELAEKGSDKVVAYKVDIGKMVDASKGLGVTAADAPAVVIFKDGKKVSDHKAPAHSLHLPSAASILPA